MPTKKPGPKTAPRNLGPKVGHEWRHRRKDAKDEGWVMMAMVKKMILNDLLRFFFLTIRTHKKNHRRFSSFLNIFQMKSKFAGIAVILRNRPGRTTACRLKRWKFSYTIFTLSYRGISYFKINPNPLFRGKICLNHLNHHSSWLHPCKFRMCHQFSWWNRVRSLSL